jgi:hypothetical protein
MDPVASKTIEFTNKILLSTIYGIYFLIPLLIVIDMSLNEFPFEKKIKKN